MMIKNHEEDEFVTVRVQDPRVQNDGYWNSYMDFKIFLHTNSKAFTAKTSCVRRRYSEFVWLKKRMQKNTGLVPIPDLPSKPFFFFSGEDFLEKRRKGLQSFLDKVCSMTVCLSDSQLHLFLQTQLPVGHILDCVQGHTPYTVTEAILTYGSSNQGWVPEEDSTQDTSLTPVPYESVESPAPHLPTLQCEEPLTPVNLTSSEPEPLNPVNLTSSEPEPLNPVDLASSEPEPLNPVDLASSEPEPLTPVNLTFSEPEPLNPVDLASSEPEPLNPVNLASSEPEGLQTEKFLADAHDIDAVELQLSETETPPPEVTQEDHDVVQVEAVLETNSPLEIIFKWDGHEESTPERLDQEEVIHHQGDCQQLTLVEVHGEKDTGLEEKCVTEVKNEMVIKEESHADITSETILSEESSPELDIHEETPQDGDGLRETVLEDLNPAEEAQESISHEKTTSERDSNKDTVTTIELDSQGHTDEKLPHRDQPRGGKC